MHSIYIYIQLLFKNIYTIYFDFTNQIFKVINVYLSRVSQPILNYIYSFSL